METATPLFPSLQPSGLGGNAPAGFPCRPQRTRRPGGGSGVCGALRLGAGSGRGRARRGAYLVHGERHADPVFLQQHGPAGRAPLGREAGGRPPNQQSCRPGAGQGARSPALGAGRRSSPGGALSSCFPPLRRRACQGSGPGVRGSPAFFLAELGPPGTRCWKVWEGPGREEGDPLGTAQIGSPGR